ncbi:MAG: cell division protein FtsH [Acidobacteria bacterium RIFCSPLOWO2_02_FULL_67_36]|nr:MAG: cell division protein FtsH [Acidobacteria bacterium RIFCSPLOWO2_02_FULL_67_36]OFW19020.1 MAG: cell division protein FtsH [Acidobacteria bacterium RIFCSPLOWO2_12_FULL_66_21]
MNSTLKSLLFWMVLVVVGVLIYNFTTQIQNKETDMAFSTFLKHVEAKEVASVVITGNEITGLLTGQADKSTEKFKTYAPSQYDRLANKLDEQGVIIKARPEAASPWATLLYSWAPILLMIGFWIFIMRQMQSGGNKALSFGKSRAKLSSSSQKKVTFKDVSGVDEAKEELQEIIEFLKEPQRFQKLGGRIPKGVLLMGPPGTGKTLLARAVAGEANVPFFSISGSDFVEMFVGVGASRVRDLFEQGKKNAPCIVFIDEIDAVGRHRGAGLGGGHDEREQTLNQLLVEMDGFESNEGVILVAATNRPDVLDPALLRPGRFDRRIVVNRPDVKGREGILAVHTKKIPLSDDVNIHVLARGSSGFSGADLANLVNEAALNAARYNQKVVRMLDFEFAKDKVMMGSERRSMIINDDEKKVTAVHEAGHALLAVVLPHADPIHKVTIIPRGMALGVTMQLPVEDKHNYSRDYLNDQIAILMGGRIAEEITMNGCTTGAGNDLERSTELARKMVCEWGMSDAMGPLTFGKKEEQIFLGREIAQHQDYSEDTAVRIDHEVKRFVSMNYDRARALLEQHKAALLRIADALLAREVLDAEQVQRLVAGEELEEHRPAAMAATPAPDDKRAAKERPSIVPPLQPLNKPLTQE